MVEKVSVDKFKNPNESVRITFKAELLRNLLQLGNTDVMRRQMLDISSVELLTQFYKVKIMFFKLSLLNWLFLARIVSELQCQSTLNYFPVTSVESQTGTYSRQEFAKTSIYFDMSIPETILSILGCGGIKIDEYSVATCHTESVL